MVVSRETRERLDLFHRLSEKWNRRINLIGPGTRASFWQRHVSDSLQLWTLDPKPKIWLDLGTGGGFPGMVMAIHFAAMQAGWVHMVESNHKKAAFLQTVLTATQARGQVHVKRVEALSADEIACDAVSARAFAPLGKLLDLSWPWLHGQAGCTGWFHKGRDYRREIVDADRRYRFDLIEHASEIEPDSVILEISNPERR